MLEPGSRCAGSGSRAPSRCSRSAPRSAATTLNLSTLRNTLAYKNEFHSGLAAALRDPAVAAADAPLRRCVSLPNNKLIPDARWILDSVGQHDIVARSQARADVGKGSHALSQPDPQRQRRGLPARQRDLLRRDRRRRRRPPRPGAAARASSASTRAATTPSMATAESPAPARSRERRLAARAAGAACGGAARRPRHGAGRGSGLALVLARRRSGCGCGASARACRSPTTPTRATTSSRTRCRCSKKGR